MRIDVNNFPTNSVSNYSEYRGQIKNGDLLLCAGSSWFSRLIQWATESIWSHVGFVMRLDKIDRVMVLESVESQGVRTVPLRKYLNDYDNKGNPYPGGLVIARHAEPLPHRRSMGYQSVANCLPRDLRHHRYSGCVLSSLR